MDELIKELKQLEEMMLQCMKCGTCQSDCPLYRTDGRESSVARGKISLLQSVYEGRIEDAGRILKHLDQCLLCTRCLKACPSGVKTDEIFLKGREILRKIKKLPKWQKIILKTAMEKPELMAKMAPLMHMGLKFGSKKIKEGIYRPMLPALGGRNVVEIKSEAFVKKYGGLNKADNELMRVVFYPGCAVNLIYTEWGISVVEVLKHFGVSVYVPETNICCGIPAASMGELEMYRNAVRANYDALAQYGDAQYIITCCPTCRYGLFEMGPKQTGTECPLTVMDILVFLEEVLKVEIQTGEKGRSTIHFPCHYQDSKKALAEKFVLSHTETEYVKLENQSCCGFAGTFSIKYYERSKGFSVSKIDEMKEKKVNKVYTPCPGCAMQLADAAAGEGMDAEVTHPVTELYKFIKGIK
ncbi:(Fe-S)-binding protein [Geovibrio sp. ADMFC3]|jgi:glycolate oxidase iron-sulfur subunit